jgi:hypothetical protein
MRQILNRTIPPVQCSEVMHRYSQVTGNNMLHWSRKEWSRLIRINEKEEGDKKVKSASRAQPVHNKAASHAEQKEKTTRTYNRLKSKVLSIYNSIAKGLGSVVNSEEVACHVTARMTKARHRVSI